MRAYAKESAPRSEEKDHSLMSEGDDPPNDYELFDIEGVSVDYHRSRDQCRVTATIKHDKAISEMKLYLILDLECRKLERRLGIMDGDEDKSH